MSKKVLGAQDFFQDKKHQKSDSPPLVIADGLKTPENMGLILRVADNAGCAKVIFLGNKENIRLNKIKKTAQTSYGHMDWVICGPKDLATHLPDGYQLIAIETATGSASIYDFDFPSHCAFVVGNEGHGISPPLLGACTHFIHIPMLGNTVSMNVSHALAVTLFEQVRRNLS